MTLARHVFISFASADAELAHRVVKRLEDSGVRCWIANRDIDPAASYPSAITAAITGSGVLLLLLTAAANQSPHVHREVELAFNARRLMLPVRIGGAVPTDDLQYFLSRSQWLDAGTDVDDAEIARVDARIRELLAAPAGRAGAGPGVPWWRRSRTVAATAAVIAVAGVALSIFSRRDIDPSVASGPQVKTNPRDGQEYAWIPPGTFTMGCSMGDPDCEEDETPAHVVAIEPGFWLRRTEVTIGEYAKRGGGGDPGASEDSRLPASAVPWAAAGAYCRAVGGRLPVEAEWEYAARAGTTARQYDTLTDIAWYFDNSDEAPHRAGTKAPNAFGLYDMLGNVSEWVRDRYYNRYDDTSDPTDVEEPLAGNALAVARGGSWVTETSGVRVSRRLAMEPDAAEPHIGFRCAIDDL